MSEKHEGWPHEWFRAAMDERARRQRRLPDVTRSIVGDLIEEIYEHLRNHDRQAGRDEDIDGNGRY